MTKPKSGYYVIPDNKRAAINAALAAAGLGDDFFSVPLIKGNGKKATHWAASCTLTASQQKLFDAVLSKVKPGEIKQAADKPSKAGFASLLAAQANKDKVAWKVQAVADREAKAVQK